MVPWVAAPALVFLSSIRQISEDTIATIATVHPTSLCFGLQIVAVEAPAALIILGSLGLWLQKITIFALEK